MPRMGQIAIAEFAATLACAGGATAIGNVTGVSPLSVLHPASNVAVLTVANINQERVPDIAPAVTGMLRPVPTATPASSDSSCPVRRRTQTTPLPVPQNQRRPRHRHWSPSPPRRASRLRRPA